MKLRLSESQPNPSPAPPATPSAPVRVFISYAHEGAQSQEHARGLAQRLQKEGMEVTLDLDWPAPAEGWWLWLEREVAAADAVIVLASAAYTSAFAARPRFWPGPVVPEQLYQTQAGHQPFLTVGFAESDAAFRPKPLARQTFFLVDTRSDFELLLRVLRGLAPTAPVAAPAGSASAELHIAAPLPDLEYYLCSVHSRLTFHRRAWRYFRSKLEGLGINLEEEPATAQNEQRLHGPGITLTLVQHAEDAEARLEISPGAASLYADLLGLVAGSRQPMECTHLAFLLHPTWRHIPLASFEPAIAHTGITLVGQQVLALHGWRFVIPCLPSTDTEVAIKILPRPPYPWPLKPLRLLLHLLEKAGALHRATTDSSVPAHQRKHKARSGCGQHGTHGVVADVSLAVFLEATGLFARILIGMFRALLKLMDFAFSRGAKLLGFRFGPLAQFPRFGFGGSPQLVCSFLGVGFGGIDIPSSSSFAVRLVIFVGHK